jgi:glycosyltransferase involved in cell wall biosynthesis
LYFSDSSLPPPPGVRGTIKRAVLSRFYERVDGFLVIGRKNRAHYLAYGVPEEKFFPFPYSVGNARFRRQADERRSRRAELRKSFGIPDAMTCVVYVGNLTPGKNIGELIRGAQGSPDTFLLVVGSGPEQQELKALAMDLLPGRHHFAGFFNQDRLGEAYTAADILALTSRWEAWGLVCNEAMNFGLPLVVSDHVGAGPDLVIPGVTGFTYPFGDHAALTRAIDDTRRLLLRDPEGVKSAVLRQVDLYSEETQARGVLRALGITHDNVGGTPWRS